MEGRKPHYPWNRALVCCTRGVGKSVWTSQAYPLWRGFYNPRFDGCKLIENSSDNAKVNHFLPLIELFTTSKRADYLQWLYQHRIPPGFDGWTTEQIKLIQEDPLAHPCLRYMGLESKLEGAHPGIVVLDDPEGSDADKSLAANDEAWRAYQTAIPLLKDPSYSQILISCTVWGDKPLAWRIRDKEGWLGESDNKHTHFKIFWRPLTDERGKSVWPERFTQAFIDQIQTEDIADQQYFLRRRTSRIQLFDLQVLRESSYEWADRMSKDAVVYPVREEDESGVRGAPVLRRCALREMRFYGHADPLHRTQVTRRRSAVKERPAEAAALVVGISPDFHAFLFDFWHKDADLVPLAEEMFRLYRVWCLAAMTFEAVGAQAWLKPYVVQQERTLPHWRQPTSTNRLGQPIPLPSLSSRLFEDDKTTESKEQMWREALSPWTNTGKIHLHATEHADVIWQLENVYNVDVPCDLVDCLAQGPRIWKPPIGDGQVRRFAEHLAKVEQKLQAGAGAVKGWAARTGYRAPWS